MTDIQQQVQEAIDELVESGAERGLQVAVYHNGEQIVDAVAGVADPETGRPVAPDTPFYCYSVGKARPPPWRMCSSSAAPSTTTRSLWSYGRSSAPTARRLRPCATS